MHATGMGVNDIEIGPDGYLVTEFVMIERLYAATANTASNDPFTCSLETHSAPLAAIGISDPMLECLDVGSSSTLGGLANLINQLDNLALPNASNASAASVNKFGSTITCDGKTVSDGVVNAYDFAVLMWAQFQVGPYAEADILSQSTVHGRESTHKRCGDGQSPPDYMLDLASGDYCSAGVPTIRRQLSESPPSPPSRYMQASVTRWGVIHGLGEWTRIRMLHEHDELSAVTLAAELFLHGVGDAIVPDVAYDPPPHFNCSDVTCAPSDSAAVTVGFHRQLDSVDDVDQCAFIQRGAADAMRGGTLAITQSDPATACRFDVFLWVPEPIKSSLQTEPCGGAIGLRAGSSANDGLGGTTQPALVCSSPALSPPSLPPPTPALPPPSTPPNEPQPSPPPPTAPPPPTVIMSLEVEGTVSDFDDTTVEAWRLSIAEAAGVSPAFVTVSITAASVRVTAMIDVPTETNVSTVVSNLADTFGEATSAASVLVAPVVSTPIITWSAPQRGAPPMAPPPPVEGLKGVDESKVIDLAIVLGGVLGGVALVGAAVFAFFAATLRFARKDVKIGGGWEAGRQVSARNEIAATNSLERLREERLARTVRSNLATRSMQPGNQEHAGEAMPRTTSVPVSSQSATPGARPALVKSASLSFADSRPQLVRRHSSKSKIVPIDMMESGLGLGPELLRRNSSGFSLGRGSTSRIVPLEVLETPDDVVDMRSSSHTASYIMHSFDV